MLFCALLAAPAYAEQGLIMVTPAPAVPGAQTAELNPPTCKDIDVLRRRYPSQKIPPCTAAERAREAKVKAENAASTETKTQKNYVSCFAAWDKNMHTLQTDFIQTTQYDGVLISQSQGRIYYAQDGSKLRLDNLDGGAVSQSALTDKKDILILDEKGKQISKLSWDEWLQGQPNRPLFDFGNYADLVSRHDGGVFERKDGAVILRFTPKDKTQNYILFVAVDEKDCFPQYITVRSDLMETTASMTDKRLNAELKKDVFKGLKK